MIEKLKPYEIYHAAVAGLPPLPAHWALRRTKSLLREIDRRSKTGTQRLLSLRMNAGLVDHHAMGGKHIPSSSLVGYKHVLPGELVMNRMRAAIGLFGGATSEGLVSPDYAIFDVRPELKMEYAVSLFKSPMMASLFRLESRGLGTGESGFLRLYSDRFGIIRMPLPPPDEQAAIVRFLDHANRRIDQFIRSKKKLIALLNEQKQTIIHKAVTHGLDPSVRMKDSGVPWLGEIPAHWGALQTRRLLSLVTSGSRGWAAYYNDNGAVFLQSGNLGRSMALNLRRIQRVQLPHGAEGVRTRIRRDDVLVCITGALTGNVVIVGDELSEPAYVNQHVALCRSRHGQVVPRFLAFCLHSNIGTTQFKASEYGGTKQGLGLDDVRNVWLPVPPTDAEQRRIVDHIDAELGALAPLLFRAEKEIALAREYRTRLVADVVTGQLDVRAAATPLPAIESEPAPTEVEGDEGADIEDGEAA